MAKGDIYYLIDQNGYAVAKLELTDNYMTGDCYTCYSWNMDKTPSEYHHFAEVYCKWDGCTHWWFKGEDFDKETKTERDGYYHLCGSLCFGGHIQVMCFIWKVAAMVLVEINQDLQSDINENYFGKEHMIKLAELFLDGCTIKVEKENSNA